MSLTRKDKTALGKVGMESLAERILGIEQGRISEDKVPRRSVTIKIDGELADLVDRYSKRAKTTRTEVIETMLWYAIEKMDELDGTAFQEVLDLEAEVKK